MSFHDNQDACSSTHIRSYSLASSATPPGRAISEQLEQLETDLAYLKSDCASLDAYVKSLQTFFYAHPMTTEDQLEQVHSELTLAHDDLCVQVRQLIRNVSKLEKAIDSLTTQYASSSTSIEPSRQKKES